MRSLYCDFPSHPLNGQPVAQRAHYTFKDNGSDQQKLLDNLLDLLLTKSNHNTSAASITAMLQTMHNLPLGSTLKENLPTSFQVSLIFSAAIVAAPALVIGLQG